MKPYIVRSLVTISLHAKVYANSEEEALELAQNLEMPTIFENTLYRLDEVSDNHWNTSGELDGEPKDFSVEEY